MEDKRTVWIHPSSYTFRLDKPDRILETVWSERPGWGFIARKDVWIRKECSVQELVRNGYVMRESVHEGGAMICPSCGIYISGIPGHLVTKHFAECSGRGEDWQKQEEALIDDIRLRQHEAKILAEKLHIQRELEEAEKRERFDRIKEENAARQKQKDRKARLKREAKEELRRR